MKFDILTLFPAMFEGPLTESIIRRAVEKGLLDIRLHQIRDFATDRHKVVDDAPYGGGDGMVMKVEPIAACLEAVKAERPKARVLLTSPRGRLFDNAAARELAQEQEVIIICGRYEGIDERVRELFVEDEFSIGDFVLTGGELAAMVMIDATVRFVPGVLGSPGSAETDTFSDGLLEYPHYTRPAEFRGHSVPAVLLSGNHAEVARWRRRKALEETIRSRPDLLEKAVLDSDDRRYLLELEEGASK
ncbi:tRNA (guanine-N1)-methyltransferase [Geobacter metallireducens RCH3]|uniref:tRNA (guanine-N(1)-)-methyltransferase n=1 Tax=Geobacter metallireducens (strain ATCC 53774 / DSM 7210 / GS-15) TaxID=269799 RepID=TRMD_GEOMG|nr:tRNA (guanosine(37)-N1)-methyltransferase TrmD [Geobacter metallireducens]Q39RN8.1 RecName: Full=tRNA (guanine-N(1)-)-methyltransferase; AltName: Full=M1G-methyltransferase; AltName: Full=tRNA [GM37] methyltransferase [Geobacter metallireducens GS-15]ABB33086.1 tRNA (N1-methyl-G37)-methyltransferase [Geobacter metallireducens GS-15]EHP84163.1 tRNA (guanine-N1)-methyltransferase [Geobacter metallireducens RCH3]